MIAYQDFLRELNSLADPEYRAFHKRLLKNDNINVLGVRVPQLRKLAKKYKDDIEAFFNFPDEYYEVTFVKLTSVSLLKWDEFIKYIDKCVQLIDNWATCDCFTPKCVQNHRDEFLPYIFKYAKYDKEFYQRFALTSLLHYYVEDKYINVIFDIAKSANCDYYYVHMAVAWLIAEVVVKYYDIAVDFLKSNAEKNFLDRKTHNKAIQKALESFRLSAEQKNFLKGIKI